MTTNENHPNMTAKEIDQSAYIKQLETTINRIRTERDNYKQALQEIKEIIKKEGYINKRTQIVKGSILYHALKDLKLPDNKILKKINKVLKDE